MIIKTRGIVLRYIRYRETSIILNIFTEEIGLQSYIVNGVRSLRSKRTSIALYQPLNLLDLVVYFKETANLQRVSEAKCQYPHISIPVNHKKSAMALFLVEVLMKSLKEQAENRPLFSFLWEGILELDQADHNFENHHLIFLSKLSHFLGFGTNDAREISHQLQAMEHAPKVGILEQELLQCLLQAEFSSSPKLNYAQRQAVLDILVWFYQWHIDRFLPLKSVPVLNQIFKP